MCVSARLLPYIAEACVMHNSRLTVCACHYIHTVERCNTGMYCKLNLFRS